MPLILLPSWRESPAWASGNAIDLPPLLILGSICIHSNCPSACSWCMCRPYPFFAPRPVQAGCADRWTLDAAELGAWSNFGLRLSQQHRWKNRVYRLTEGSLSCQAHGWEDSIRPWGHCATRVGVPRRQFPRLAFTPERTFCKTSTGSSYPRSNQWERAEEVAAVIFTRQAVS